MESRRTAPHRCWSLAASRFQRFQPAKVIPVDWQLALLGAGVCVSCRSTRLLCCSSEVHHTADVVIFLQDLASSAKQACFPAQMCPWTCPAGNHLWPWHPEHSISVPSMLTGRFGAGVRPSCHVCSSWQKTFYSFMKDLLLPQLQVEAWKDSLATERIATHTRQCKWQAVRSLHRSLLVAIRHVDWLLTVPIAGGLVHLEMARAWAQTRLSRFLRTTLY